MISQLRYDDDCVFIILFVIEPFHVFNVSSTDDGSLFIDHVFA